MSLLSAPPRSALVVSLRYLGDALLATPLAHALKRQWPACDVDMLVFERSAAMVRGNPDLRDVITVPERPSRRALLAQLRAIWRRYDLALIHQTGTRPLLYGWAAARVSIGMRSDEVSKAIWQRLLLNRSIPFDMRAPTVLENMKLLQALGIDQPVKVVPPVTHESHEAPLMRPSSPYVVLHPGPRTQPKRWTLSGWRMVIGALKARGLTIVITGGAADAEIAYVDELLQGLDLRGIVRVDGHATLADVSGLIGGARLYVGVDTGTTHLAAATGVPVVALFGPTDPVIWGPWPATSGRPYEHSASLQQRGNVQLIQNPLFVCMPCQQEGCLRHPASYSACLDTLPPEPVLRAIDKALTVQTSSRPGGQAPPYSAPSSSTSA